MSEPSADVEVTHPLVTAGLVVYMAAKLLRSRFERLPSPDRMAVLEVLERRAEELNARVRELAEASDEPIGRRRRDRGRIDDLVFAAETDRERIDALEAAALDAEAAALVSDARIRDLVAEVEELRAAQDRGAVIDEAKAILMQSMQISDDAAFAVLVAASQRDDVDPSTVARRLTLSALGREKHHRP